MSANKFAEVTTFVRDLIALGGVYATDEDGYVVSKVEDDDKPVLVPNGTKYQRLMVIQEVIGDPDAVIINPLHEDTAESIDGRWLYTSLAAGLTMRVIDVVHFVRTVIEQGEEFEVPAEAIKLASRHADFDAKAFEHFNLLTKDKFKFMNVTYNRRLKEAHFRCSVFEPSTRELFPQVTSKSWKAIESLMTDLFGTPDSFTTSSELITVPKLDAILTVYLKIYTKINKYLDMIHSEFPDFVVDLTTIGHHLSNISEYYDRCKWFNGQIMTKSTNTSNNIPNIPSNASNISTQNRPTGGSNIPDNPAKSGGFANANPMFGGMSDFTEPQPTFANGRPMTGFQGSFTPAPAQRTMGFSIPI